jgi:hypothetical protein
MSKIIGWYKDWWPIYDELPEGFRIDKKTASPLCLHYFIQKGNMFCGNYEKALLKVDFPKKESVKESVDVPIASNSLRLEAEKPKVVDVDISKPLNNLARLKLKETLLKDIAVDLCICEIEGWDKREYLQDLKSLIDSVNPSELKKEVA